MNRITESDIKVLAKDIETQLKADGFKVKATSYFAYGKYGYYFDFNPDDISKVRQIRIPLGTKRECLDCLSRVYRNVIMNRDYFMGK